MDEAARQPERQCGECLNFIVMNITSQTLSDWWISVELDTSPTLTDVPVSLTVYSLPFGRYFSTPHVHCCITSWRRVADNAIPARAKRF